MSGIVDALSKCSSRLVSTAAVPECPRADTLSGDANVSTKSESELPVLLGPVQVGLGRYGNRAKRTAPCSRYDGQLVVREHVGPPLGLAEPRQFDARHWVDPELACRQNAPVAGYDAIRAVDQDRVCPPEFRYARGDAGDLLGGSRNIALG
jgi:hypothetical protein